MARITICIICKIWTVHYYFFFSLSVVHIICHFLYIFCILCNMNIFCILCNMNNMKNMQGPGMVGQVQRKSAVPHNSVDPEHSAYVRLQQRNRAACCDCSAALAGHDQEVRVTSQRRHWRWWGSNGHRLDWLESGLGVQLCRSLESDHQWPGPCETGPIVNHQPSLHVFTFIKHLFDLETCWNSHQSWFPLI